MSIALIFFVSVAVLGTIYLYNKSQEKRKEMKKQQKFGR